MRAVIGATVGALLVIVSGASLAPVSAQKADAGAEAARIQKARDVVQTLSDRFRVELTGALKGSGGAMGAIGVCQTTAPELIATAADESSFEISRVALRIRNPDNAPDAWEEGVMKTFQKQAKDGADVAKLEFSEIVVTPEGDKLFRYMKAIPTAEMCLACHGTDIKTDVKAEIQRTYPDDKATGFKLGELRGAFSVLQVIEE